MLHGPQDSRNPWNVMLPLARLPHSDRNHDLRVYAGRPEVEVSIDALYLVTTGVSSAHYSCRNFRLFQASLQKITESNRLIPGPQLPAQLMQPTAESSSSVNSRRLSAWAQPCTGENIPLLMSLVRIDVWRRNCGDSVSHDSTLPGRCWIEQVGAEIPPGEIAIGCQEPQPQEYAGRSTPEVSDVRSWPRASSSNASAPIGPECYKHVLLCAFVPSYAFIPQTTHDLVSGGIMQGYVRPRACW